MVVARIIFLTAVSIATIAVILMAIVSPIPYKKHANNNTTQGPSVALSLYIQQPRTTSSNNVPRAAESKVGALIYHRMLTEGPESTSRVVGKVQGFIIPVEHFAYSVFNIIYLTFETREYSGSLSIQAKDLTEEKEGLPILGGTGSFAFARGHAVLEDTGHLSSSTTVDATYQVRLHFQFPDRSETIPAG